MKLSQHIVFSAIVAAFILLLVRNPLLSLVFFITAVFIDLDHLLDYFLFYFPKEAFHPLKFVREKAGYFLSCVWFRKKVVLIFHSFELLAVLLILGALYSRIVLYIAFGIAFHLSLDIFWNIIIKNRSKKICFYFIVFRAIKGFECRNLLSRFGEETDQELKSSSEKS
ncbi:MAG TPA: hypothetical protein ENN46_04165 [Candidatus Woesearchaeota archaeon]|nr:hypothetical protein [Candidatus Woesearchaeota archaeon]